MRRLPRTALGCALVTLVLVLGAFSGISLPSSVDAAANPFRATVDDGSWEHLARKGAPDRRPNVVVFLTDDMRADELRFMPHVRALLADKGRRYKRALSPHPMCCPARAELVTGQYGHNNGVRHNTGAWGGWQALTDKDNTIAAWLADAGYASSYHGKYMNGYHSASQPRPAGWTRWDAQTGGIYDYGAVPIEFYNGDRYAGRYITDVITERVNQTITAFHRANRPFFTLVNHVAPHTTSRPHDGTVRPLFESRYAHLYRGLRAPNADKPSYRPTRTRTEEFYSAMTRARARALRSVDDSVAAVVEKLRETGELANTYMVFTSDNGHQLGEHAMFSKNSLYEESLRVPLVIRGPGIAHGTVERLPVTLVDLAATFVDWTGIRPGRRLDGLSLTRLRTRDGTPRRDTVLVQTGSEKAAADGWGQRGVVTGRYTYGRSTGTQGGVLFDNRRDPFQLHNLWDRPAYAEIRTSLSHRTDALIRCAGRSSCNQSFGPLPDPR